MRVASQQIKEWVAGRGLGTRTVVSLFLLGVFCASVATPVAFAQGCALCYTTAASQGPRAARSLDLAILVLLVPTLLMFVAVLVLAFRRRNAEVDDLSAGLELPGAQGATRLSRPSRAA